MTAICRLSDSPAAYTICEFDALLAETPSAGAGLVEGGVVCLGFVGTPVGSEPVFEASDGVLVASPGVAVDVGDPPLLVVSAVAVRDGRSDAVAVGEPPLEADARVGLAGPAVGSVLELVSPQATSKETTNIAKNRAGLNIIDFLTPAIVVTAQLLLREIKSDRHVIDSLL